MKKLILTIASLLATAIGGSVLVSAQSVTMYTDTTLGAMLYIFSGGMFVLAGGMVAMVFFPTRNLVEQPTPYETSGKTRIVLDEVELKKMLVKILVLNGANETAELYEKVQNIVEQAVPYLLKEM